MRKKVISPEQRRRAARAVVASELCSGRAACRFEGVEIDLLVSEQRANQPGAEAAQAAQGAKREACSLRVSANRRPAATGGLAGRKKTRAAVAKIHRAASAAHQTQGGASWRLHGAADEGRAPGPCLELGLHLGCHHARRSFAHADDSGRIHP